MGWCQRCSVSVRNALFATWHGIHSLCQTHTCKNRSHKDTKYHLIGSFDEKRMRLLSFDFNKEKIHCAHSCSFTTSHAPCFQFHSRCRPSSSWRTTENQQIIRWRKSEEWRAGIRRNVRKSRACRKEPQSRMAEMLVENEILRDPLNGDLHKNGPCPSDPPPWHRARLQKKRQSLGITLSIFLPLFSTTFPSYTTIHPPLSFTSSSLCSPTAVPLPFSISLSQEWPRVVYTVWETKCELCKGKNKNKEHTKKKNSRQTLSKKKVYTTSPVSDPWQI